MKPYLIPFILALVIIGGLIFTNQPQTTLAGSVQPTVQQAAQAYEASQFAAASQAYQQVVNQGIQNGELYYNLGNAYFKQGDLGRAILNYRRAAQLSPRDEDIRANLALAQEQTIDQLNPADQSLINQIAQFSATWLSLNETALVALTVWFLLTGCLMALRQPGLGRFREGLQYVSLLVGLCLIGLLTILASRLYVAQTQPAGIVIAEQVDVSSGPGRQYVTEFTLHSGTEVKLLEIRPDWVRLALPGEQLQGWVPATTVEKI